MSVFAALRSPLAAGLFDQAIVSFGNFGLNIALARILPLHDYGVISVVLSFMLFLNTLHAAFVCYPLSVRTASAETRSQTGLLGTAAVLTVACAPLGFFVLGLALTSVSDLMLLPACGALLLWQMQEVFRRGALASARHRTAILTDLVRYLGVLATLIALRGSLSSERVLVIIAAASAFAALPMLPPMKKTLKTTLSGMPHEAGIHWRLGAPVLGANVLAALSTQWFLWLTAWTRGPETSAALVALANIVAISSPVMFGVENIMVPEIARLRGSLSFGELKRLLCTRGAVCMLLLAPFFAFIGAFPQTAMRLFYGTHNPFQHETLALRLLVLAYASYLISYILGAALRGYRCGTAVLLMQLFPALLGLTLGTWLTVQYGLLGACTASLLAGLLRAALGLYFVFGLHRIAATRQATAMALDGAPP